MPQEKDDPPIPFGEPQKEEWVGDVLVEKYEDCVRLVQPRDGRLAPESIVIPNTQVDMVVAALIEQSVQTTVFTRGGDDE